MRGDCQEHITPLTSGDTVEASELESGFGDAIGSFLFSKSAQVCVAGPGKETTAKSDHPPDPGRPAMTALTGSWLAG